jgi:diadenylate cyclase
MPSLDSLLQLHWRDCIEILIFSWVIYKLYFFLKATRGASIVVGLFLLLIIPVTLSNLLKLKTMSWLLQHIFLFLSFAIVIIFQPELRRMLAEVGSQRWFRFRNHSESTLELLLQAMTQLSAKRYGALIAIKQQIDLKPYAETGVHLDATITPELLTTLFFPKTTLHDGGIIIDQDRIDSAGCVFPVSQKEVSNRTIGLRHRAAIGITEETDSIVLIVSEETGALSLCYQGKLEHDLEPDILRERLQQILSLA